MGCVGDELDQEMLVYGFVRSNLIALDIIKLLLLFCDEIIVIPTHNSCKLLQSLETTTYYGWRKRKLIMEYIHDNLESNHELLPLFSKENCLLLINGWTTQIYDQRNSVKLIAIQLFPFLLNILLNGVFDEKIYNKKKVKKISIPNIIFQTEYNLLSIIFNSLFNVLKQRLAEHLHSIVQNTLIDLTDILCSVAQNMENSNVYYNLLLKYFHEYTNCWSKKYQKCDRVRVVCITCSLWIIYGSNGTETKESETRKSETFDKLAKTAKRAFLFENKYCDFIQLFANVMENGMNDKSHECRTTALKCLLQIEKDKCEYIEVIKQYISKRTWKHFKTKRENMKRKSNRKVAMKLMLLKRKHISQNTDDASTCTNKKIDQ